MTTLILGASSKEDRYSHQAHLRLKEAGHQVIPVHPFQDEILGDKVTNELSDVEQEVDTITVYLNPSRFEALLDQVLRIAPRRVIFNPGSEIPQLYRRFPDGIEVMEACTLIMLGTGQY